MRVSLFFVIAIYFLPLQASVLTLRCAKAFENEINLRNQIALMRGLDKEARKVIKDFLKYTATPFDASKKMDAEVRRLNLENQMIIDQLTKLIEEALPLLENVSGPFRLALVDSSRHYRRNLNFDPAKDLIANLEKFNELIHDEGLTPLQVAQRIYWVSDRLGTSIYDPSVRWLR